MRSKIIPISCLLVLSICSAVFVEIFMQETFFEEMCRAFRVKEPVLIVTEFIYSGSTNPYERLHITDNQKKTVLKLMNSIKPVKNPKSYKDSIWTRNYHNQNIDYERIKFFILLRPPSGRLQVFAFRSPEEVIAATNLTSESHHDPQLKQFSCSKKLYNKILRLALASAIYEYPDEWRH